MEWETVVGLETHVELNTETKIFCGCTTAFGGAPNTHCCPVCTGMPGALPVLNRKVVEYAIRTGVALGGTISPITRFDRKNYFYPDLPKAYQISQLYLPICVGGCVTIEMEEGEKQIGIHEMHMEEDAGKLIHEAGRTQIDYNRCGVPLLEIVTEPDFRTGAEVIAYLEQLKSMLTYLGVSDCKMQEGSLRCDVNLSVRPKGSKVLGTRTELKNLSSFRAIAKAVEEEAKRQIQVLEAGGTVLQETRRWDEEQNCSYAMRSKETAKDYRYFPDPDLPALQISREEVEQAQKELPELAPAKRQRYQKAYGLSKYDAEMLTTSRSFASYFERLVELEVQPKAAANWMLGEVLRDMKEQHLPVEEIPLSPEHLAALIACVTEGKINRNTASEVFSAVFHSDGDPIAYIQAHGLEQISDESAIAQVVAQVVEQNPQSVSDWKSGKQKAFGFLVGQTMRKLGGKGNPQLVRKRLEEQLN